MEKITDLVGDLIPPGEAGPEVEAMLGRDIPPQSVPHVVATATNDEANIIVDVPSNVLYANDGRIPQISIAPASDFSKSSPNTATKLEYVIPEAIEEETEAVVDEIQKHQQFMPTQYVDHAIPQGYAMQPPTTELQQQMMAPPQMDAYGAPPPEMQMQMQMQQPEQFQGMMAPTPQYPDIPNYSNVTDQELDPRMLVQNPAHDYGRQWYLAQGGETSYTRRRVSGASNLSGVQKGLEPTVQSGTTPPQPAGDVRK
eukprot:GHVU01034026.1.p1 GENE.GHVU01034026.1~~GHVU01034026.1.p1  ORF type:complete len:255 (+),score=46.88 GHVU01034026.1:986-1750(+)